jgi:uncharacterized protein with von Willebrand factor type A (vWA) domain
MSAPAQSPGALPSFLMPIVAQLRRRRLAVGVGDVRALRAALQAGFGLASVDELRELCVALWAKSPEEAQIVRAAFARADNVPDWTVLDTATPDDQGASGDPTSDPVSQPSEGTGDDQEPAPETTRTEPVRTLGGAPIQTGATDHGLVLTPQYPLTAREVAQAWRHLRRPVRYGPAVELDIAATISERGRRGVAVAPVVIPRRRNAVRLLLLIDRHGSMTPAHGYVDHVVGAISEAGRIDDVQAVYYHDLPGEHGDRSVLDAMPDPFRADLDPVLPLIGPLRGGRVYDDPGLTRPRPLDRVLEAVTGATAVLVISDAGAARGKFDIIRLLDTVALLKAVRAEGARVAWLNPVPTRRWPRSTAGQVARYVPMFPFTRPGLDGAVDALRGAPTSLEHPL